MAVRTPMIEATTQTSINEKPEFRCFSNEITLYVLFCKLFAPRWALLTPTLIKGCANALVVKLLEVPTVSFYFDCQIDLLSSAA